MYLINRPSRLTDHDLVEKPADKWPDVFGKISLLVDYPYLLPCAVAASITFTGAFLDKTASCPITHVLQGLFCRCFWDPMVDRGTARFVYP